MKRILLLLLFAGAFCISTNAQIYQKITGYGHAWDRLRPDSVLHIPEISDTLSLKTNITRPQIRVVGDSIWWFKGKWRNLSRGGSGVTDTTSLSNRINLKVNIADTASMLQNYAKSVAGMPIGGATGQILAKNTSTNYDAGWIDNYTADVREIVKAGESINKGQAVYVSGADGTNVIVSKASNNSEITSSKTLGLLYQNLSTNAQGFVIIQGKLSGINTLGSNAGDPVWLGTNGNLLFGIANKPVAPAHMVYVGVVTRVNSSNGEIFVNVQNGFEFEELHNVLITDSLNNQVIAYDSTTRLWKNRTIESVIGYTPARKTDISGTINYLPKYLSSTSIGNSAMYDSSGFLRLYKNNIGNVQGFTTQNSIASLNLEKDGWSGYPLKVQQNDSVANNFQLAMLLRKGLLTSDNVRPGFGVGLEMHLPDNTKTWQRSGWIVNRIVDSSSTSYKSEMITMVRNGSAYVYPFSVRPDSTIRVLKLAGSGSRIVTADANGDLSAITSATGLVDTTVLSTRDWRQKGVDSVTSIAVRLTGGQTVGGNKTWSNDQYYNGQPHFRGGFVIYNENNLAYTSLVKSRSNADLQRLFFPADTGSLATERYVNAAIAGSPSGTVTSITAGTGLSGGTITTSGTISSDTTLLSTRQWRQKGVDSVRSIAVLLTGNQTIQGNKSFASDAIFQSVPSFWGGMSIYSDGGLSKYSSLRSRANTGAMLIYLPSDTGNLATERYVNAAISASPSGTVTSITAGTGLTGGTISTSGTISSDTTYLSTRAWRQKGLDSLARLEVSISDTASMLTPYLRKVDTTSMLTPYYRTATATNALASKVNISDTASMLSPYYRSATATAALLTKLNNSDTATMLSPYLRKSDTTGMLSPYARTATVNASIGSKLNISDTSAMLSPYYRSAIATASLATKLNISDTGTMLTPYLRKTDTTGMLSPYARTATVNASIATKLNTSDTATMLSPYLRTSTATASLATKLNISDTTGMLSPYLRKVDTTLMLSPYARTASVTAAIGLKLNISDTSTMLSPYVRSSGYGTIKSGQSILVDTLLVATRAWEQKGDDSLAAIIATKGNGTITGSGTSNYIPKLNTSTEITNSQIFDDGTNVGVASNTPSVKFEVGGSTRMSGSVQNQSYVNGSGSTITRPTADLIYPSQGSYSSTTTLVGTQVVPNATISSGTLAITGGQFEPVFAATGSGQVFATGVAGVVTRNSTTSQTNTHNLVGVTGSVSHATTQYYTNVSASATGIQGSLSIQQGEVGTGYGLRSSASIATTGVYGKISTYYGLHVGSSLGSAGGNVGNITTYYDTYLAGATSVLGGSSIINRWGLYQANSLHNNYFAGNVGVNTTSATEKLDVDGKVRIRSIDSVLSPINMLTVDANGVVQKAAVPSGGGSTVTFNRQAASYTLSASDVSKSIEMNVSTANNLTVPTNATASIPVGSTITIIQYGTGRTTIVAASGVTIRSANGWLKLAAQYGAVTLIKVGTDEWYAFGALSA